MTRVRDLASLEQTRALASEIARALVSEIKTHGFTIGLSGELGGGKTAFSREVSFALGVTVPVSSPTFVLEHQYEGADGVRIEHWDLYRLGAELPEELFEPVEPGQLRLIEWIDRSAELTVAAGLHLTFQILGPIQRRVAAEWQQNAAFATLLDGIF